MRRDIFTGALIVGLILSVVLLIANIKYAMPEAHVIDYQMGSWSNEKIGEYPVIHVIYENGFDKEIELPKMTFDEAREYMLKLKAGL